MGAPKTVAMADTKSGAVELITPFGVMYLDLQEAVDLVEQLDDAIVSLLPEETIPDEVNTDEPEAADYAVGGVGVWIRGVAGETPKPETQVLVFRTLINQIGMACAAEGSA